MYSSNTSVEGATWKWMAHETGHLFGLLDEDFKHQRQTLGYYSLMANNWSNGIIELGAWDRYVQGWLSDSQVACLPSKESLTSSLIFELSPIEKQNSELKSIIIPISQSKVMIIESRRNGGFDVISKIMRGYWFIL